MSLHVCSVFTKYTVTLQVFCSCFFLDICVRMTTYRQLKRLKLVLFAKLLSLDAGWYDKIEIGMRRPFQLTSYIYPLITSDYSFRGYSVRHPRVGDEPQLVLTVVGFISAGHLMEQMTITMSQVEISVGSIIGESLFKVFLALIGFIGTMPQGWRLSLLMNGIMIPANLFR